MEVTEGRLFVAERKDLAALAAEFAPSVTVSLAKFFGDRLCS
jgi:hypothetical protein